MIDETIWRMLTTGRCFVYVLPCREQDSLKIGYARDPWTRMRAFHPRFHAFFDLDRGALVETDHVSEARAIEKTLKLKFSQSRETAPLEVRERAGGKFEWFRGVNPQVMLQMQSMSVDLGYLFHAPLREWLREQWLPHTQRLADWGRQEYEQIEAWHFNADPGRSESRERALRNLLDAWASIGLPIEDGLTNDVQNWYRHGFTE